MIKSAAQILRMLLLRLELSQKTLRAIKGRIYISLSSCRGQVSPLQDTFQTQI
jgi:hypothetical protein